METTSEISKPSAEAMIFSLRAMGYDLSTAVADLVDNSISANASRIHIDYSWNDGRPWIRISDNGHGMNVDELRLAMKPGSKSPNVERASNDLGRFGLGLKTASWSQCKRMTVLTKKDGVLNHRCWDLDHIIETDEWNLLLDLDEKRKITMGLKLSQFETGTVVLWEKLDRVVNVFESEDADEMRVRFQCLMTYDVLNHLQMVFHRYLSGKNAIKLFVGRTECVPWDPFMSSHSSTEQIETEIFADSRISITPYILPHSSKLALKEKKIAQGPKGWALQQGFYVYRQKRMIIGGGYLDLSIKPLDHYRLGRIKVDITNDLDHEWCVDVKKSTASPPLKYRKHLERIAKRTCELSTKRYRSRTTMIHAPNRSQTSFDVWTRRKIGEKYLYKVNTNSPAIEFIRERSGISKSALNALLHLVERTVPHRDIIVDNNDCHDSTINLPDEYLKPPSSLVEAAKELCWAEIERGKTKDDAVDFVCQLLMPIDSPQLRIELEKDFLE